MAVKLLSISVKIEEHVPSTLLKLVQAMSLDIADALISRSFIISFTSFFDTCLRLNLLWYGSSDFVLIIPMLSQGQRKVFYCKAGECGEPKWKRAHKRKSWFYSIDFSDCFFLNNLYKTNKRSFHPLEWNLALLNKKFNTTT